MAREMRIEMPSWEEVYELARKVAFRIVEDGFDPDLIIAIGRGGYTPGRLLADFLHKKALTSFRIEHYAAGAVEEVAQARVVGSLDEDLSGRRVLVVDDVNDSGKTLEVAVPFLRSRGAAEVRTAVLQEKGTTRFAADYVGGRVAEWRWIVYPWAVIEDLTRFIHRLEPRPAGVEEAARRLEELYDVRPPARTLEDVFRLMPATEARGGR
jgi:uncharacterized protein